MAELTQPTEYVEDAKGRIAYHCGGKIADTGETHADKVKNRNASGWVFLHDAEPYDVIVRTGADEYKVASGVAAATTGMFSLMVRVRAVNDAIPPVEVP